LAGPGGALPGALRGGDRPQETPDRGGHAAAARIHLARERPRATHGAGERRHADRRDGDGRRRPVAARGGGERESADEPETGRRGGVGDPRGAEADQGERQRGVADLGDLAGDLVAEDQEVRDPPGRRAVKSEIRSTKSETIPKYEQSNDRNRAPV